MQRKRLNFFFSYKRSFFFNKCLFNLKRDGKTRNKKERKKKSGCLWHWVGGGKGGRTRNRSWEAKSRGRKSPGRVILMVEFIGELHLNGFYSSSNSWWSPLFL